MWTARCVLVCCALYMTSVTAQQDATVCKPPPEATDPTTGAKLKAPDNPAVGNQFEAHIVLNILTKNFTTELHQYFDFQADHSVIQQREYGHRFQAYANYDTNEFIGILPESGTCTVDPLNTDENRFLFGYKKTTTSAHVPAASAVLHLLQDGEDSLTRYVGKQTIRGIPCNVWYTCTYWDDMKSTMDVYWYFSDMTQWKPSGSLAGQPDPTRDSVPVRAWVKGRRYDTPSTHHDFEHKYEFFHWKTRITRPYYWQTPRGISCPGRKNTRPLPILPNQFSFTLEQVDQGLNLVSFVKESYDYNERFFQYEYRASGNKLQYFGDRMLREVHDFNTGVAYITDIQRGNCSVMPIDTNTLDDVNVDQTHVQMRTAVQFLYLDGVKPTYEGIKVIRGMDCDVWVANRADFPKGSGRNVTWEFAFLAKTIPGPTQWKSIEGLQATEKGGMPIQLTLTQDKITTYYNLYNFQSKAPNVLDYSVKTCYWNRDRRIFTFSVDGQYMKQILSDVKAFKRGVLTSVANTAKISKLRIGDVKVMFYNNIKVRVVILDKAPIPGDVLAVKQQFDLKTSGDLLLNAILQGTFVITPENPDNGASATQIPVIKNSVKEAEYILQPPFQGYGSGTSAGVAVAMLLVGLAIGGVLAVFVKRKFLQ